MKASWLFSFALLVAVAAAVPYEKAQCERYQSCNGEMCSDICKIGTVALDAWVTATLAFQRQLQFNRSVFTYEVPGTHNGAIAQDYGMGIEEEALTKVLEPIYGAQRSVVVIANQRHSLTDQLRMGVRHIEVDIYFYERLGGVRICHWPVCPPDFYIIVERAAQQQGLTLDWDCANLGCDEKKPFYTSILQEVRDWLDLPENRNEFVTIFLDNKNLGVDVAGDFAKLNEEIVGDIVFRPSHKRNEYPDRWPTVEELVTKGRRLLLEQQDTAWQQSNDSQAIFWTPTIWDVQFGPDNFSPYPSCLIGGNDYYNKRQARSLDGSLTLGPAFLWEGRVDYPLDDIKAMADCSVPVQSLDQISPGAMEYFVYTWKRNEPNPAYSCTLLDSDGRWRTADCSESHRSACLSPNSEFEWSLSSSTGAFGTGLCSNGYVFALPRSGRMNRALTAVASGQPIWINYRA